MILGGGADCPAAGSTPTDAGEELDPRRRAGHLSDARDNATTSTGPSWPRSVRRSATTAAAPAPSRSTPRVAAVRCRSPCAAAHPARPVPGPTLWERYRQDGDGDGHAERFDFADAVATAALILRKAKGAPPTGGSAAGYRRAACAYYGACSDAAVPYADQVMARAAVYGFHDGQATDPHAADNLVASTRRRLRAPSRARRRRCGRRGADRARRQPPRPPAGARDARVRRPRGRHLRQAADRHHRHQPQLLHRQPHRLRSRLRPRRRHRHGRQRRHQRRARRRPDHDRLPDRRRHRPHPGSTRRPSKEASTPSSTTACASNASGRPTKAATTTTTSTSAPDQARELALRRQARPCTARTPTNRAPADDPTSRGET